MQYTLRPLVETDRQAVTDIFNYFVVNSFSVFRDIKVGLDHFGAIFDSANKYPAVVAVTENKELIGFAWLKPYKPIRTCDKTAVITYFIMPDHTGAGLGSRFLGYLKERARAMGIDTILASVSSRNDGSIRFHLNHGFVECGRFPEVGIKFGEPFDFVWFVKKI